MINIFARKTISLSKVISQLTDQLYQTQRDRLTHTSAAERHNHLATMCLCRKERLENEMLQLEAFPAEKSGLFRRVTIASIVKEQLNATQVEYLDNVGQEKHHHALAVMCELRVARLRKQIEEMNPDAKVEEAPVQYSTESLSPKDEGVRSPAIQRKADNGDIAMPTWGQRKEPVGSMS